MGWLDWSVRLLGLSKRSSLPGLRRRDAILPCQSAEEVPQWRSRRWIDPDRVFDEGQHFRRTRVPHWTRLRLDQREETETLREGLFRSAKRRRARRNAVATPGNRQQASERHLHAIGIRERNVGLGISQRSSSTERQPRSSSFFLFFFSSHCVVLGWRSNWNPNARITGDASDRTRRRTAHREIERRVAKRKRDRQETNEGECRSF